jgi:hypothetical protein
MTLNCVRRIFVLGLALALAMGLVAHSVRAADMDVKMTMPVAGDMAMPGKCDGCRSGNDKMSGAACAVPCGSLMAISVADFLLPALPIAASHWVDAQGMAGSNPPPDPYPPRPLILS